nr:hypothetical protein [Streptomyces monomycini]
MTSHIVVRHPPCSASSTPTGTPTTVPVLIPPMTSANARPRRSAGTSAEAAAVDSAA